MFVNTVRSGISRACQTTVQELRRSIAKTTSAPNSDALTARTEQAKPAEERATRKLLRLKKYHRSLSTLPSTAVPPAASGTAVSKDESRDFMSVFPDIVRDLTDAGRFKDIPDVTKWFAKSLQYNVPRGKKNRGLALVHSFKTLAEPSQLTPENIRKANILGWCVELTQAFLLVSDDVMDSSEMRRGIPCWYRHQEVGLSAINDATMIENSIFMLLKRYFREDACYTNLIELFHDIIFKTAMGQCLDLQSVQAGKPRLDLFTMDRYDAITKYKTAYYSFQLPVASAMFMTGKDDVELHRQATTIMLEMGQFYQIQDDFLDCFGNPEVTGKNCGTDIREGKCSWLTVVALQRASPEQRAVLERYYGSPEPEHVQAVLDLYEELNIPHMYSIYEEESYNLIRTHIQQISRGMPHKLFFKFMEKIYRRDH